MISWAQLVLLSLIILICLVNIHVTYHPLHQTTPRVYPEPRLRRDDKSSDFDTSWKHSGSVSNVGPQNNIMHTSSRHDSLTVKGQPEATSDAFRPRERKEKQDKQHSSKKLLTRNFNAPRAIEGMVVPGVKSQLVKRTDPVQSIPIYYINLKEHTARRKTMERHLDSKKLKYTRVEALSDMNHIDMRVVSIISNLEPNEKEIACIASHLVALHTALHDTTGPYADSPFAMILEDDVQFEFNVNLNELVYNAPPDFDVLQLLTSNVEQTRIMYELYKATVEYTPGYLGMTADEFKHKFLWSRRAVGSNMWSTQAYVVRKDGIQDLIDSLVRVDPATQQRHVTIRNTNRILNGCPKTNIECRHEYPFRLVADIYVYDLLGTGYTCRLPLMNGGDSGGHSSSTSSSGSSSGIQAKEKHEETSKEFRGIAELVEELRTSDANKVMPANLLIKG